MSTDKNNANPNKKIPLEIAAYIEQINKRERKYASINKIFTLNVKRCKKYFNFNFNYIFNICIYQYHGILIYISWL